MSPKGRNESETMQPTTELTVPSALVPMGNATEGQIDGFQAMWTHIGIAIQEYVRRMQEAAEDAIGYDDEYDE